jgi:hypothetical protein
MLALANFPVYFDTTFEQRLSIFKLGNGDQFTIPDVQADGQPTCALGRALHPAHQTGCPDPDCVVYESARFHTPYVAVKVRPRLEANLEEEQLGFQLLRRMLENQTRIAVLRALPTPTDDERKELSSLTSQLENGESFLEFLIDVQRTYGISSYL